MTEMTKDLPTRSEIPEDKKWNLASIFATDDAWEEEFQQLSEEVPHIKDFQHTLGESADNLYDLFDLQDKISERLSLIVRY